MRRGRQAKWPCVWAAVNQLLPLPSTPRMLTASVPIQHLLSHPTPLLKLGLDLRHHVHNGTLGRREQVGALWSCASCHDVPLPESLLHTQCQTGPTCHIQTHWTLTLSGLTVSIARGPSPSSGWDVTGGEGPRDPGAVERRSLSSRE